MKRQLVLEICADSMDSVLAAERGGAQRIELCASLLEGGLTPSAGFIREARKQVEIDLFVMIRPRGGDFCYSELDVAAMKEDVRTAKGYGANGVVLGLLTEDGQVDVAGTRELVDLAQPLESTFHRAFDVSADLDRSLEDVIRTGANRILTSGGAPTAFEGIEQIRKLVGAAGERIIIMAGSGINSQSVARLITATSVTEVHASAKARVSPAVRWQSRIAIGSGGTGLGAEYSRMVADEKEVTALASVLSGL